MNNSLFAFNISQEIPDTEIGELEDKAEYNPKHQVWKGIGSTQLAGFTGTKKTTGYSTQYCCPNNSLAACATWCYATDRRTDSSDSD